MIKKLKMEFIERLDNILYRCEKGAISNNKNSDKIRIDIVVKSR